MSDWETSRQQWLSWIEGDAELQPSRRRSFDAFDDDLRQLLEQSSFLGRIVPEPVPSRGFEDEDITAVRTVPPAGDALAQGEPAVRDRRPEPGDAPLEVGMASSDGALEVQLAAPPSAANGQSEELEGLVIPTLTRQASRVPAPTPAQAPAAADRSASSSQTAGEIVSAPAAPARPAGPGDASDGEPSAPRKGTKIVVSASVAQVTPPLFDDDDTAELDTTDLVEAELPEAEAELPEAEVEEAELAEAEFEVEEAELAETEVEEAELAEAEAAPREPAEAEIVTPPPAPPPKARAKSKGPTEVPPAPPKDKVTPIRPASGAPDEASAETQAALAQLQATVRAPTLPKDSPASKAIPGGWFEEAFGAHYASLLREDHVARAEAEVEFILSSTKSKPGARVLDVGCGTGEHAIAFAQRGLSVTGLDHSAALLERAMTSSDSAMAGVQFVHGDMRELSMPDPYDLVVCVGTTLGYFDDETNKRCIQRLAAAVNPGGRLVLHVFNRDQIIGRLPARSWWQTEGCLVLDEANMNYFTNRLHVHRTVAFDDGRQIEHDIYVRGYSAHELGKACVDAGLRVLEISGSIHTRARFYGSTSPEIWLVLERPTD